MSGVWLNTWSSTTRRPSWWIPPTMVRNSATRRSPVGLGGRRGVRALGCHPVPRVVAPVEGVLGADGLDAGLLLVAVRRERLQVAPRGRLRCRVLRDRGDVEGRQQVHRVEPRRCERLEVLGAVAVLREREVGTAVLGTDRGVVDREVAHVELVDRRVDVLLQHRRLRGPPERRLVCRVGQVHGHRPGRVQRQRDRVRVGDQGRLDLPGARHVDGHLVEVASVPHTRRAGP